MFEIIEKLLILQDRDQRIRRQEVELARIEPERQRFKVKAANAQSELESAKLRVKQTESARKELELEVEGKKQLIARYANQQFQTRKNEEYRALAHEIELCKDAIFKIEDQEIELMEQGEAAQKEVARAAQAAKDTGKLVEEQIARLDAREANLKKELAELQANREMLASAVDETARARYERLVRSKGENVVVGVQHGVCGGCHMRVPPQLLVTCQSEKELVSCSNCGRLLYYTRDMDLAVTE
ncbi:MAG TPA: C4-type zinc ribbon domain-containing protein [Candidatus Paceibacterota bacterium]|nr:C4-type zinc ribbon domain-containing protein [Verrucomicrobiota bacterium]HSA11197.1 C4-type zinc ribbon domain-containing protein [Candidatus Paceibacterota bacterium]